MACHIGQPRFEGNSQARRFGDGAIGLEAHHARRQEAKLTGNLGEDCKLGQGVGAIGAFQAFHGHQRCGKADANLRQGVRFAGGADLLDPVRQFRVGQGFHQGQGAQCGSGVSLGRGGAIARRGEVAGRQPNGQQEAEESINEQLSQLAVSSHGPYSRHATFCHSEYHLPIREKAHNS
jgi:hypothetical protein